MRVLSIGEFSTELCGGTHVRRAGDIGLFHIVGESGVAAGVRRIEAVTGQAALDYLRTVDTTLDDIAGLVRASRATTSATRCARRSSACARWRRKTERSRSVWRSWQGSDLAASAIDIGGVKVLATRVDGADAGALRAAVDQLKSTPRLGDRGAGVSGAGRESVLVAGVTADQTAHVKAGELIGAVAAQIGGRGGGRRRFCAGWRQQARGARCRTRECRAVGAIALRSTLNLINAPIVADR